MTVLRRGQPQMMSSSYTAKDAAFTTLSHTFLLGCCYPVLASNSLRFVFILTPNISPGFISRKFFRSSSFSITKEEHLHVETYNNVNVRCIITSLKHTQCILMRPNRSDSWSHGKPNVGPQQIPIDVMSDMRTLSISCNV